jgi:hypothetical protein
MEAVLTMHAQDKGRAVTDAIGRLADGIDPSELGNRIGDAVVREIDDLSRRADEDLRNTARAAARRSLSDVWAGVRTSDAADGIPIPPEGIAFTHELVHRGAELGSLLRAYRLGHAIVEESWAQASVDLGLNPAVANRALAQASRYFFRYVDAVCTRLTTEYEDERRRWARGTAAIRADMLERLLEGELVPAVKATTALRYDVNPVHTGFVLWADPELPTLSTSLDLDDLALDVVNALGAKFSLVDPVGNWVVWGWVTGVASATTRFNLPDSVRVALGNPAEGVQGFVRTHQEAMEARRVAGLLGPAFGPVVHHAAVALLALMSADPMSASRFVDTELGDLATSAGSMARLRETLRVYFDENASPSRTARRLGINKNTVVYRVAKAEELLGHDLFDRRAELDAALRLAEVHGPLQDLARSQVPVPTGVGSG